LGAAVLFWVAGFDIIYACQDTAFDRSRGLHSIPARFGVRSALRLAAISHAATVVLLAALPFCGAWSGVDVPLGWLYGLTVGAIAVLLVAEHRLVRPDDLSRVNLAFFHVNAIISLSLFVAGSIDLLWW
jgi:4-hydroxybenzoate polyprenyltransferase